MSAYITVPRDLTQVKPKVALNLTKRQLICFSIGAAIGVPSFFVIKHFAGTTAATGSMIIIMLPMFLLAMFERNGQFLETILRHYIEARVIRPKVRPYKTDNYYSALMREMKAQEEVNRIVELSKKNTDEKKAARGGHRTAKALNEGRAERDPGDRKKRKKE